MRSSVTAPVELDLFVQRASTWLAEHAPAFERPGSGDVSPFAAMDEPTERAWVSGARAWQRFKHAHGWAGLALPTELGGQGLGRAHEVLFAEQEARYRLPTDIFEVTLGMVLPTLVRWSSAPADLVGPILRGEQMWCQLFSEPGAGSDLAAVSTTATQQPNGSWRVSGQKVWTSWAFFAERGYLLARTADGPRHRNLTAFELDMGAPGVTVRRLTQVTGASTFNEVYLDNVSLPADAVIGGIGNGWPVAMTTLMNERLAVGPEQVPFRQLRAEAERRGRLGDPLIRDQLGDVHMRRKLLELLRLRMMEQVRSGEDPGPEGSAGKLFLAQSVKASADTARAILGPDAATWNVWTEFALASFGIKVAGGTDEIQKNIVAERILGLPREPVLSERPAPPKPVSTKVTSASSSREDDSDAGQLRRSLARALTRARGGMSLYQRLRDPAAIDARVAQAVDQLGLVAVAVPESADGAGATMSEFLPLVEEAGRHLELSAILTGSGLALPAVLAAGSSRADDIDLGALLAPLATGSQCWTAIWPGVSAPLDCLTLDVGTDTVRGRVEHVLLADRADTAVLIIPTVDGATVCLAELAAVPCRAEEPLDITRSLGTLDFHAAPVTVLGKIGCGALDRLRALWLLALASDCLGGIDACLGTAVDYAKNRVAFGRPIGSFQAVKHRCADMFVLAETTRVGVSSALSLLDGRPDSTGAPTGLLTAALAAATQATTAYVEVADAALLLHGGIGFTYENDSHFYVRRAYSNAAQFGGARQWRSELVDRLA